MLPAAHGGTQVGLCRGDASTQTSPLPRGIQWAVGTKMLSRNGVYLTRPLAEGKPDRKNQCPVTVLLLPSITPASSTPMPLVSDPWVSDSTRHFCSPSTITSTRLKLFPSKSLSPLKPFWKLSLILSNRYFKVLGNIVND